MQWYSVEIVIRNPKKFVVWKEHSWYFEAMNDEDAKEKMRNLEKTVVVKHFHTAKTKLLKDIEELAIYQD